MLIAKDDDIKKAAVVISLFVNVLSNFRFFFGETATEKQNSFSKSCYYEKSIALVKRQANNTNAFR